MLDWIKRNGIWAYPVLAMVLIAPFTPWLDLTITGAYFKDFSVKGNSLPQMKFWDWVFSYGVIPGIVTAIIAGMIYIFSFYLSAIYSLRKPALALALGMAIGSGLIVHVILKDHWGRPRPKQVIEFGGKQEFRPFYSPNFFHQPEPSKSFPCGHCSVGFYFFSLALIGRRYNSKNLYYLGMFLAFGLGILLGWGRIAQGGHFFSDVLVSALIMRLTALWVDKLLFGTEKRR
jgi:membrane-associated PAP2 superfamily phosphatase